VHATAAWSTELADRLIGAATPRGVHRVALAALFDGALSFVEGFAIHRRWAWSGWLVVVATSCLLPFEILALVHHLSATRSAVLVINVAIVAYLIRHRVGSTPERQTKPED
jgi:uncharacterized membrane protein (DUF2068 family)